LEFTWYRFDRYRHQKAQVQQWDADGLKIKRLADKYRRSCEDFIVGALDAMGVRNDGPGNIFFSI